MAGNAIIEKSFSFSIRIVNLSKYLQSESGNMYYPSRSFAAAQALAQTFQRHNEGRAGPILPQKMAIALKEANETQYWLRLLHQTNYLTNSEFRSLDRNLAELLRILTTICKTATTKIQ